MKRFTGARSAEKPGANQVVTSAAVNADWPGGASVSRRRTLRGSSVVFWKRSDVTCTVWPLP